MWQRPRTWIVLVLLAVAAVVASTRYFERAFPLVAVELEMDRAGALGMAESLAESMEWPTAGYRQAASFGQQDDELKRYIDLEAGGPAAWTRLVESGAYAPYRWRVRQFREGEATESEVWFGPAGTRWGYEVTLPEDEPGAALDVAPARALAEAAAGDWGVDLAPYELVEMRAESRPGGRVDHWFVYQRDDLEYGEARFRLRLGVAGDRAVEVAPYAEVPESFERRYAEMRSANDLIALMASLSSGLLYLLLGAGVGLVVLLRKRWVVWRRPLLWGGVIGGLMAAASLNELPIEWIRYDTAVSASGFLTEQVMMAVVGGLLTALYAALVLMAGESLARRAFPDHIQLWKSWSRGVANSRSMLGMTAGGYVFAAFFMAGAVLFYMFANGVLGWPVSGESLLHPDVLATPFPWLSAVAISLMAGFTEEAMFRAIPLAGAALIGARYGRRGLWIGAALVIQALIFAGAHANYPQQPSYARVVELFLPSIALGLVFLRFGFMPAVIGHFAYDMVWFSIPVFAASSAAGTWLNQTLLVLMGLLPLAIVLAARARWGATDATPADANNGAWRPAAEPEPVRDRDREATPAPHDAPGRIPGGASAVTPASPAGMATLLRWAPALGLAGLLLWGATESFRPLSPPLELGPGGAADAAEAALLDRSLLEPVDGSEWRLLPTVHGSLSDEHRFVWETAGPDVFSALLGTHLKAPHWDVRAARFEGELDARAEEMLVEVSHTGDAYRVRHTLPEERPGASLEEERAAAMALDEARARWALAGAELELEPVSAEANQRPSRMDWTFTYAAPAVAELTDGQARVRVGIAGDRVTDATRFVHIPERWERERRAERTRGMIIGGAMGVLLLLLGVTVLVAGVRRLSRGALPTRVAAVAGSAAVALVAADILNGWPSTVAGLSTSEPFGNQVIAALAGAGFLALVVGALAGVATGLAHAWARARGDDAPAGPAASLTGPAARTAALRVGLPAGALVAGIMTATGSLMDSAPPWASYGGADAALPFVAALIEPVGDLFLMTVFVLLAITGLRRAPARSRGIPVRALLAVALGLIIGAGVADTEWLPWLVGSAIGMGLLYAGVAVVRARGAALVPLAVAAMVALDTIPGIIHGPFPGARPGLLAGVALTMVLAVAWAGWLADGTGERRVAPAEVPADAAREPVPAGGDGG